MERQPITRLAKDSGEGLRPLNEQSETVQAASFTNPNDILAHAIPAPQTVSVSHQQSSSNHTP